MPEQTIYKHWFGAFIIFLTGGGVMSALLYLVWFVPFDDDRLNIMLLGFIILIGLYTTVALYVYTLNKITLNKSGIEYTKYTTLFYSTVSEADWNTVQSIDVRQSGIFAKLLGFGDLLVQTADQRPNLGMTNISDVYRWKKYVDDNATFGAVA